MDIAWLILKPFQGEVGEPGQKGSKADKGEQVSKFNCKILIYTHSTICIQNQFYLKYNDWMIFMTFVF